MKGYSTSDTYVSLFIGTLAFIYLLNFVSLTCLTSFLLQDSEFKNWLYYKRRGTPEKESSKEYETSSD